MVGKLRSITDGVVSIRRPFDGDGERLIAGRDEAFHRFMGEGSDEPEPAGCVVVEDQVVGWVDFDADRDWLEPGEVNLGYSVFAEHRGNGYATRAVKLLLHHLALTGAASVATLLIHPDNTHHWRSPHVPASSLTATSTATRTGRSRFHRWRTPTAS